MFPVVVWYSVGLVVQSFEESYEFGSLDLILFHRVHCAVYVCVFLYFICMPVVTCNIVT